MSSRPPPSGSRPVARSNPDGYGDALLLDLLDLVGRAAGDLDALLEGFLARTIAAMGAQRGMLLDLTPAGGLEVRLARLASGAPDPDAGRISRSIPLQAVRDRRGVCTAADPDTGEPTSTTASMAAFRLRSVVCVPLEARQGVLGVIYLDSQVAIRAFEDADLARLKTLADHLALHLENARLLEERRLMEEAGRRGLEEQVARLQAQLASAEPLVGECPAMRALLAQADRVAASEATVLLLGETGTGKEALARRIHEMSRRAGRPMVIFDPGSVPETLLESELFGHEKGAFTGAEARRLGRFELAAGGTLFLDEIGDLPLRLQSKFLRVLEERRIQRLGGTRPIEIDVRILAATNRDLDDMVARGEFRSDLFYRLSVVRLTLPPLRLRGPDRLIAARRFLAQFADQNGRRDLTLSPAAEAAIARHSWPGNVRELKHRLQRAAILAEGPAVQPADLDLAPEPAGAPAGAQPGPPPASRTASELAPAVRELVRAAGSEPGLDPLRRRVLQPLAALLARRALAAAGGNRTRAGALLGIERRRLGRLLADRSEAPAEHPAVGALAGVLTGILDARIADPTGGPHEDLPAFLETETIRAGRELAGDNVAVLERRLGFPETTLRRRLAELPPG